MLARCLPPAGGAPAHRRGQSGASLPDPLEGAAGGKKALALPDVALALEEGGPGGGKATKAGSVNDASSMGDSEGTSAVGGGAWGAGRGGRCVGWLGYHAGERAGRRQQLRCWAEDHLPRLPTALATRSWTAAAWRRATAPTAPTSRASSEPGDMQGAGAGCQQLPSCHFAAPLTTCSPPVHPCPAGASRRWAAVGWHLHLHQQHPTAS